MTEPFEDEPSARYVGVGIGKYSEYPPLPGAPIEARQIADLLAANGVQTVVAAATTEPELIAELARALPPRPEGGGALVVLWAGHGDRLADASLRLVAHDTIKKGAPLLTAEYVASVAVRSGATQVLLIFDTCFSGGGALPALEGADRWFGEQVGPPGKVWLGVLASAMDWEKARDDLFGDRLARLLREGPGREDLRLRWSAQNAGIRGDDLIDALQKEWADDAPHRPKAAQFGNPWVLLPNPRHDPAAPPRVVEHLLLAARGGEPEDETWYFTGRHAVIARLVSWIVARQPGLHVVTGPAGCGKSAVLGLVVCLSNPEQRAALLARGPLDYADPDVGSVQTHVYARGLARNQLVRELDGQLSDAGGLSADRRGQRGVGELVDAVAASPTCPVIVIDGLDEAGLEAWPIAEDVLRPLARHAVVLVGTRDLAPPDEGESLVTRLQPDTTEVVHLLEEVNDASDIHDYVVRRLRDVDAPAMDAGQIADAILALPADDEEGRFLLARVITAQLRTNPVDTSSNDWQQHLSTSVEDALDRDLAALPVRIRGQDRLESAGFDLLAALAWAQGGGLPDDIWPLIATAISADSTEYTRDDVFWALTTAGRYIVEAGEAGHAVYRLSHQRLAQHLRNKVSGRVQDAELRIAAALVTTYQALLEAGVDPIDHPYLRRYTWRHCADAETHGIAALRGLVGIDRAAFLPDLALALRYLADRQVEAGKPFEAVGSAEEAATLYRELAATNPGRPAELANALLKLGVRYGEVGRRADAVAPAEEAVSLYRAQAETNPAYLPNLAGALANLGSDYNGVGRRADAVVLAEEAVSLYRAQAETNPAYLPDLAGVLVNLGAAYNGVGRRADAVAPTEEAVSLYRAQAETNSAYLPDLALALGNLGNRYGEMGRRADAVVPAEEAVSLYRAQGETNPAYLPDLARVLVALGKRYSEVGRRADAVVPAEEAVSLYRAQAETNPAYLPDLAGVLSNLGVGYSQVGRRADAVAPTEEAVSLYRAQAETNPAYLPNLALALGNLGKYWLDAGLPWNADAAWSSTLHAMPTSNLKAALLLERARRETPPQAGNYLLAALALTPAATGSTLFSLHSACRELRHVDAGLFDAVWQERLGIHPPSWLFVDDVTLTTTGEWLDTPTYTRTRDYHRGHAEILARPQVHTALDELALLGYNPDLISQYHQLLATASEQGIQQAYQHLVVTESLAAWLDADIPEKQQLLCENREILLSGEAAELLAQLSSENPVDVGIKFGTAMLVLAQDGIESEVLTILEDPEQLNTFLGSLLASDKPQQLLAASELLLCLDLGDQVLASAELHLAIALALTGHPEDAPGHARTAAHLDPNSVNRWVGVLAQQIPAHPELASLIQTLVTQPDEPDDTGSDRQADPGP